MTSRQPTPRTTTPTSVPSGAVAFLLLATLLTSHEATAQTLEELQRPLLAPGHVTVSIDQDAFAFERNVLEIGSEPASYFEPFYHALNATVTLGLSKTIQIAFDAAYLFPSLRSYQTFSDPGSRLDSHWLVKSLRTQVTYRPSPRMEIRAMYLSGRSRYDSSFPVGNGTSVDETADTNLLQLNGIWLPRPDRESRPRRADLDGLSGPLLGRHRGRVDWEGMWRRYGSMDAEDTQGYGHYLDAVHATDLRLRLGVGYGLRDRLELSGDGYWQPAFTVADSILVRADGERRVDDQSRSLSAVFGARMHVRWRPAPLLGTFAEATWEHQTVTFAPDSASSSTDRYHQRRLTFGATWLARSPRMSAPLNTDLNGLYRPLLERHQLRLDAAVHVRRSTGDYFGDDFDETAWRVQAAVGIWSFLEAGIYAGRFREGPTFSLFQDGTSFGSTVTLRPGRQVEAYGSVNYHPKAAIQSYPAFNLPRGSYFQSFQDFTNSVYEDDASVHVGLRLVF